MERGCRSADAILHIGGCILAEMVERFRPSLRNQMVPDLPHCVTAKHANYDSARVIRCDRSILGWMPSIASRNCSILKFLVYRAVSPCRT